MKEKTLIGLRTEFLPRALVSALISVLCLFAPYYAKGDTRFSLLEAVKQLLPMTARTGLSVVVFAVFGLTALSGLLGILSQLLKGKVQTRIWQVVQVFATLSWVILLFAGKMILEGNQLAQSVLVKDFSICFWLGLVASIVTLVFLMKATHTNTGYIVLTVLSVIWVFPVLWIVLTSLRAEQGYYVGYFFPKGLTLQNFANLFGNDSVLPFGRWWVNTLIVATCSCIINTLIILAVAYTLSRTRFSGRKAFMNILMIIGMFPGFMSLIAVYNILKGLGLNQSLLALIVVGAAGAAMGYHVTKGFFDTIPKALDEAAIIDGANRLQIFIHVTLPLSKSIIVYTVLGSFLGAWSDYIFPSMLFGDKQSSYTVAVGLFWLTDFRRIDRYYTQFAAGAVIVAVPIVILFIFLQRFYVEGLSGSVKG
jgi:arabinogalactan oligomer/maltooligosaccharide transport system permease protein